MKTIPRPFTGLLAIIMATIMATVLVFSACKKQDDESGSSGKEEFATVVSESDASAEVVFDDVFNNVMGVSSEVGIGGTGVFGRVNVSSSSTERVEGVDSATCYIVTTKQLSVTRFPLQITIDFGSGCTDRDGRTRKGKIIITYTGHLFITGNSASATFDGYYFQDMKVEGTYTLTNTGTTDKKSYTTQITNAKLSLSNDNYMQCSSEKTITQTEGGITSYIGTDDTYTITGQASGSVQKDEKYFQWSSAITSSLTKKFTCRCITKGTISLKKGNEVVAELDYGSGSCDNKASFTVNGVVHEITLH